MRQQKLLHASVFLYLQIRTLLSIAFKGIKVPGEKDHTVTLSISLCKLAEAMWMNSKSEDQVNVSNYNTNMGD